MDQKGQRICPRKKMEMRKMRRKYQIRIEFGVSSLSVGTVCSLLMSVVPGLCHLKAALKSGRKMLQF